MDSQQWDLVLRIVVFLAAVAVGSAVIVTTVAVWARQHRFGFPGTMLCAAGLLLIGLSIFSSFSFSASPTTGVVFLVQMRGGDIVQRPPSIPAGPTQIGFWTPSSRTKESPGGVKGWEIVDDDSKLDQFADVLMKGKIIEGYRRYEVIGAGLGSKKIGSWWVSTNGGGNFNLSDFLKAYADFWKPGEDSTYMEVIPINSGGYPSARH